MDSLDSHNGSFAFSPNGSKFAAVSLYVAYVYDVASLTRLGTYTSPWAFVRAAWMPDGRHVMVSGRSGRDSGACVWDFIRPEAPSVVTAIVGLVARFRGWSPSAATYFVSRKSEALAPNGPPTFMLEERRAADRSLVRAVSLGPDERLRRMLVSPNSHALVLHSLKEDPPRIVVFE